MNTGAEGDVAIGFPERLSFSGHSFAAGSRLAAASIGMILSPFLISTSPSPTSSLTKRRLGELHGRNKPQEFLDSHVGSVFQSFL